MENIGDKNMDQVTPKKKGRKRQNDKVESEFQENEKLELSTFANENQPDNVFKSPPGSEFSIDDLTSPLSKRTKFDFFAQLREKRRDDLTVEKLTPGAYWNQELKVAVVCKRRNSPKLLNVHAYDGTSYVQIKAFHPLMDRFKDIFQNFKTYSIVGFQVRTVDEKFRSELGSAVEVILGKETSVSLVEDNPISVPFTPVPLNEVKKLNPGTTIDVTGILVKQMDVTRAKSGKFYKEIFIVDQTEETISVFLWEADAEEFKGTENEPIAIRGALIRKQNDDNVLNIVAKSTIEMSSFADPDGKLKSWFNDVVKNI